ncbi:MAG: hypothetical protein Q9157_008795 [Trypethelium eluteriae]
MFTVVSPNRTILIESQEYSSRLTQAVIEDLIEIKPEDFDLLSIQALEDGIHAKYADRVIQGVGLCICLWDLLEASEGRIGNGTGIAHVNISLDFFDDIWVPCPIGLPKPSSFDESEGVWMWNSQNGDAAYDESEQASMTEDGLGPIRWWDEEAEGEEGEEEVEGVEAADGIEVEGQSNGF